MGKKLKLISFFLVLSLLVNVAITPMSVEANPNEELAVITQVDGNTLKVVENGVVSYINQINENEFELIEEGKTRKITKNSEGNLLVDGVYDSTVSYIEPSIKNITISLDTEGYTANAVSWKTVATLKWDNYARNISVAYFMTLAMAALGIPPHAITAVGFLNYVYSIYGRDNTLYYYSQVQQRMDNTMTFRRYLRVWKYYYMSNYLLKSAYDYDYYIWD